MVDFAELVQLPIDFEGQKLASKISYQLINIGAIISFVVGFAFQRLDFSVYLLAATIVTTEILVVIPFPFYNRHPVTWLKPTSTIPSDIKISSIDQ